MTQKIFERIKDISDRHMIKIIAAFLTNDKESQEMLSYCKTIGLLTTDISVNYDDPTMNLLPFDPHPSKKANRIYAGKLYNLISQSE